MAHPSELMLETLRIMASLDYVGPAKYRVASCMRVPVCAVRSRIYSAKKSVNADDSVTAVLHVLELGRLSLDDLVDERQLPFDKLTRAQSDLLYEIYNFVKDNGRFSLNDVAAHSFHSPFTIHAHITSIYRVLGIRNRAQLATVVYAYTHNNGNLSAHLKKTA